MPSTTSQSARVVERFPFSWRGGVERVRQVWRVALHPKFRGNVCLLRAFIPAGGGCIDIGANHGRMSIELARAGHRVMAFEPLAFNLWVLRTATRLSGRVRVVPTALGDHDGEATIFVPLREDNRPTHGAAFVAGDDAEAMRHTPGARLVRQTIRIQRLDDVDLTWLGGVRFIKIDVEGHEPAVLRGARRVLGEHRPTVLMECWAQAGGPEAVGLLGEMGYMFYDLDLGERGRWTANAGEIAGELERSGRPHDVLAWHAGRGEPPAFRGSFASTRFGR
ncbi:MAG: FkbM family methyltransferase [Leptolyngbya sp. PLA3]|nr:MAG: FkbM family methyltransferase [Cyanobacteria bacterium CYA]MCE7970024.1 FkbM family methyltransferase [Leptolyngbya sp. PL-A3]